MAMDYLGQSEVHLLSVLVLGHKSELSSELVLRYMFRYKLMLGLCGHY